MVNETNGTGTTQNLDLLTDAIAQQVADKILTRLAPGGLAAVLAEPKLLSVKQAAPYIGRTPAALRSMIINGDIPAKVIMRQGSRVFIVKKALDAWINAQ